MVGQGGEFPAEEDAAPLRSADGEALTFEQKSKIMQAVDEGKRAAKKEQMAIASKKKAAALGISIKKKDGDGEAGPSSSTSAAAGGGAKAVKALLSPGKGSGDKAAASSSSSPAGGGAKAALALKSGGKGKDKAAGGASGGATKKGGGKKKGGGLLDKAKAAAADGPAADAPAEAPAEPAPPPETPEERMARLQREEAEREAERERAYKEREEQRMEIEMAIIEEERRLRAKEQKKREQEKAERKRQQLFREAAFDGDLEVIQKQIAEWIEETFGATLLGYKVDCADENKTTPLSEAACAGQLEVVKLLVKHGANINLVNSQTRTPLWRAAFMDKRETAEYLLSMGGDPRIKSEAGDSPDMVAPSTEMKELFANCTRRWHAPPPSPHSFFSTSHAPLLTPPRCDCLVARRGHCKDGSAHRRTGKGTRGPVGSAAARRRGPAGRPSGLLFADWSAALCGRT